VHAVGAADDEHVARGHAERLVRRIEVDGGDLTARVAQLEPQVGLAVAVGRRGLVGTRVCAFDSLAAAKF